MKKTLTKAELVENIAQYTPFSFKQNKDIVEHIIKLIKQGLKENNEVLISGFGKFESYSKNPRKGRNPQTNETIILPGRKVVVFRISKKFKQALNPKK